MSTYRFCERRTRGKRWGRLAAFLFPAVLSLPGAAQTGVFDQPYRPQVHFSPQRNWTNDPNGLVYFRNEYHLFFQYNPFGDTWGHMSWGHAVSTDLLHWQELPVAIPEKDGLMIFTGSVVVDRENSSGLCDRRRECLVAIYTGDRETPHVHRQSQNVAVSQDNGRTWQPFAGNPVLDLGLADFRDPSVTWSEGAHRWTMAVSLPKEHKIQFYASPDLKHWSHLSDFGPAGDVAGDWECPDLLQVPSSDKKGSIWALKVGLNPGAPQGGSGEQYFLGSFDGTSFKASSERGSHGWTNYGKDDYCAIGYNDLPKGRKPVLLGWMNNWQYAEKLPTAPWRGQMSLPRELTFLKDEAGVGLRQMPITAPLRSGKSPFLLRSGKDLRILRRKRFKEPVEVNLRFGPSTAAMRGIRIRSDEEHWTEIGFDGGRSEFYMDRSHSGQAVGPGFLTRTVAPLAATRAYDVKLIIDRSSIEAYAQDGTIAMTNLIYPNSGTSSMELFSSTNELPGVEGEVWKLGAVWK